MSDRGTVISLGPSWSGTHVRAVSPSSITPRCPWSHVPSLTAHTVARPRIPRSSQEEPRPAHRGGRRGRGGAPPRAGAPAGRGRGTGGASERREVDAAVEAHGGQAEDRELSVHDALAEPRRGGGRGAVRGG